MMNQFLRKAFIFLAGFEWQELPWESEEFSQQYRRRTPEEIIRSGYFLGCYEPTIILYEQAREQEIPVRFVQMIDMCHGEEDICAHCFLELKLDGKWIITDPTQRKILKKYPADYIFFSEEPYKWNSFLEFYEAQKRFIKLNLSGEKG